MQWRPDAGGNSQVYFDPESDKAPHWGWSWLERWMAARPWENRLMTILQKFIILLRVLWWTCHCH
jgi:hypothetical protein